MPRTPKAIMQDADQHEPESRWALFSGGNDSTALTHVVKGVVDGVIHVNTGIGIEATREFVRSFCRDQDLPLHELHPPGWTYDEYVVRKGFPGPRDHGIVYWRLKELAVNEFIQARKATYTGKGPFRVVLYTGLRRSESLRRSRGITSSTQEIRREGSYVWVNPIIDWTERDVRDYRIEHGLPENPVSALLHRSGECLCGCFIRRDELAMIEGLYPEVGQRVRALEARVKAAGQVRCKWGADRYDERPVGVVPAMCTDCQLQLDEAA